MSKYLVKILSICALVVMLCVSVVGAGISVSEAIGCTLTLVQSGSGSAEGAKSNVKILLDGKEQLDKEGNPLTKIQVAKYTTVTVEYDKENSVGYEFKGWYEGSYDVKDKPITKKTSYTFDVEKKNTKMIAVRDLIEYTITYQGKMDDGETDVQDKIASVQHVKFNSPLADLTPADSHIEFGGWRVVESGAIVSEPTKVANFDVDRYGKEITVEPDWSNRMLVSFYDANEQLIFSKPFSSAEELHAYTLPGLDNADVAKKVKPGYEFKGWKKASGDEVTTLSDIAFEPSSPLKLYIKQDLITYTLNVAFNKGKGKDDKTALTFDMENGFADYTKTRDHYELVGLDFNGTTYNYDKNAVNPVDRFKGLSTVITAPEQKAKTLEVTAVWTSKLCPTTFYISATTHVTLPEYGNTNVKLKGTRDGNEEEIYLSVNAVFSDEEGKYNFDLTDDIVAYINSIYTNIHTPDGKNSLTVSEVKISVRGTNFTNTISEITNCTFARVLEFINGEKGINIEGTTPLSITVELIYKEA